MEGADDQLLSTLGEPSTQLAMRQLVLPLELSACVFAVVEFLKVADRRCNVRWDSDRDVGIGRPGGGREYTDIQIHRWSRLAVTLLLQSIVGSHLVARHFHVLEHGLEVVGEGCSTL